MNDWDKLYGAALEVQNERSVSSFIEAGSVAAALLTGRGHIYRGVCIDTACSLGMCAERNAIANMITNGEDEIDKILIIMPDGRPGLPCGACMNILVKGNHLSGELETVCPGRRKPIYMWRSRCPEDADLQDSCRQVVKFIRSFPDSNHTPLS